ncbi:MAG: DNA polymerase I [Minisyncoccia bacterium]
MKKFVLIDGNAIVHRAFHALPALTTNKGVVTNAVYGFTSILLKTIKDFKPEYIAAAFDLAGPTFRHEQYDEYKAKRIKAPEELYKQIPIVKEILKTFGIPVYEKQGYEADDLIGTLATMAKKHKLDGDLQTIIATGDLDTLQLVDGKKVVVFTLRKGMADTIIYDEDAVMTRYGLKPEQLNDYRGLKGDPSDNIPGVPGIGEKTAIDLIKEFGSLDELYKKVEKSDLGENLKQKLVENKDKAYFSKQLSEIVTDLKVDFSLEKAEWRKNLDLSEIEKAFKDLSFFSLLKRLPEIGLGEESRIMNHESRGGEKDGGKNGSKQSLLEFKPGAEDEDENIFATDKGEELTASVLGNTRHSIVGHDLKNILKPFIAEGADVKCKLFDTMIAAYLLHPDQRDYDFHKIYYDEFKEDANDDKKTADLIHLKKELGHKIRSQRLEEVFETIEMPLIKVLAEMELAGIKIDTKAIAKLQEVTSREIKKLETKIYKLAGHEFNISSPQQLAEILYDKLAIKGKIRKTGGGALSTAAPELEKLRDEHPIIDLILDYRELAKLESTYIGPFPELIDKKDGRIHTTYNQCGTATGRLSSENPNLQNIPIKTKLGQEFRKAFIAERGYRLTSFDYSQLDLRVVAHIAKDKKMIEAFKRGDDIHTRTAVEIFGVKPEEVTRDMRRQAKVMNFGIIYGMGTGGFSRASGVDHQRAREFITKYFAEFSGVARYVEEIKKKAHKDGYVETIFGRRRQLLDIYSTMPQIQSAAERAAINHPVQGTSADLMKLAMIKVDDFLRKNYGKDDARILLQVHDELVCEIKSDLVEKIAPEIKKIMETVHKLEVPLVAEAKSGSNWQEVRPLE